MKNLTLSRSAPGSILFAAWLALALLLLLQAALGAPASLASVQSEWQVQSAYPTVQSWMALPAFGGFVLALRLVTLVACSAVSALIAWQRPVRLLPWLAAFALLGLPGLFNQGDAAAPSSALLSFLGGVKLVSSALGLPALLLLFFLFPDGRFHPARLRLPVLVLLVVLTAMLILPAAQVDLTLEWGWAVLMLLFLGLLLAALASQALRYRAAGVEERQVLQPLLTCLAFFPVWLLLSTTLGEFVSLAAGQALVLSVPLALAWSILHRDVWGMRPAQRGQQIFLAGTAALLLLAPLGLFALFRSSQSQQANEIARIQAELETVQPRPVIVDTDMAMDDILAILYLLNHPGVDLRAITVTGTGEAHCQPGVKHALELLELQGAGPVPVTCGRETPLAGTQEFPAEWRQRVDRLYGLALPHSERQPAAQSAAQLILDITTESPGKIVVVALGPLTNLAEALQTDPGLAERLEMVYIMGGAVDVGGNVGPSTPEIDNPYAEWNIFADPHAANIVLRSGVPTTWVALDTTQYAPARQAFYEELRANQQTKAARFAFNLLYINQGFVLSGGYFFWDVLTATITLDESLARFEEVSLSVVETPGQELGRTIRDPDGSLARLATWADGPGFENRFLLVLNRR